MVLGVAVIAALSATAVILLDRDDGSVTVEGGGGSAEDPADDGETAEPVPGGLAALETGSAAVQINHLVSLPTGPDAQFDGADTVGVLGDSTLLALGVMGGGDIPHTLMWRSGDGGRTWTPASPPVEGLATAVVGGGEDDAVAVGYEIVYDGEVGQPAAPLAWTTTDGGNQWTVHPIEGTDAMFQPGGVATDGEGTLVAGGVTGSGRRDIGYSDPAIVVSDDGGVSWEPMSIEIDASRFDGITSVAYGNGRFVAIGYLDEQLGEYDFEREIVVWVSEDGRDWERSRVDAFGVEYAREPGLIGLGDGVAAVFDRHSVALSDNGVDWRLVPLRGLDFGEDEYLGEYGDIPHGGVRIGDQLVLVGDESYEDGSGPRAWVANLAG